MVTPAQPAIERVQVPLSASSSRLYPRFFCPEANLTIEVDGEIHQDKETKEYDLKRTRILAENGIRVLRFWNSEVENEMEKVLVLIAKAVDDSSLKF